MTVQKRFPPQKEADYAFRRQYSQHKVWVALASGETKTFFAEDCSATWLQMSCGHVREVLLSQQDGLNYCLRKEKYFRKQYRTVEIYRRMTDGTWSKHPIMKFISGHLVEETTDPLPADIRCPVYRKPKENFIGFDVELGKAITTTAATVAIPDYVHSKQPAGMRSATEPSHISKFMQGSAARYSAKR